MYGEPVLPILPNLPSNGPHRLRASKGSRLCICVLSEISGAAIIPVSSRGVVYSTHICAIVYSIYPHAQIAMHLACTSSSNTIIISQS